jgi:hypothetical protein
MMGRCLTRVGVVARDAVAEVLRLAEGVAVLCMCELFEWCLGGGKAVLATVVEI